jgi:hypothetical protein
MNQATSIEVVNPSAQPVDVVRPAPDVTDMLRAIMDKGVTSDNVLAFGELVKVYERMEDRRIARDAEKAFTAAFVLMQSEIPKIQATKPVLDKQGGVKYKIAPLEDIDEQARPILQRYGFTTDFSEGESPPGKITKIFHLRHIGGFVKSNQYSVRVGSGPPGATESQADGSAHMYAKRGAYCDGLNIIIGHQDDDARAEGGPITADQAKDLERRVKETGSDEKAFLKFAGAANYAEIAAAKYSLLDSNLRRKERTT